MTRTTRALTGVVAALGIATGAAAYDGAWSYRMCFEPDGVADVRDKAREDYRAWCGEAFATLGLADVLPEHVEACAEELVRRDVEVCRREAAKAVEAAVREVGRSTAEWNAR